MATKILRWLGWTLISLGLVVLEFAAYELIGTGLIEKAHQNDLRHQFQSLSDNPVISSGGAPPSRVTSTRAIADLKIPKISVDVIVVDGVKLGDLVYGPGRYPSSAHFGEKGSVAIAGHRTGWGSPFLNLDRLAPGDAITIKTLSGATFSYRVTRTMIVEPEDGKVIRGNPDSKSASQLTLTTCTPKYTSLRRLIVWADLAAPGTGGSA
ncbi:MAG: class E sortase [Actinomycetota bacterium]